MQQGPSCRHPEVSAEVVLLFPSPEEMARKSALFFFLVKKPQPGVAF
jgi:hypothetical protein